MSRPSSNGLEMLTSCTLDSLLLMLKINIFSSICGRGTRAYNRDACIRFLSDEVDILSFVPSLWSQSFQWGLRFMICDSQNVATWYLCAVKNVNCCVNYWYNRLKVLLVNQFYSSRVPTCSVEWPHYDSKHHLLQWSWVVLEKGIGSSD